MSKDQNKAVTISAQQWMEIEMICTDNDSAEALRFLKEMRDQIKLTTIAWLKSHLDQ